jgi:uncharacterized FlaG/YvyC family protein
MEINKLNGQPALMNVLESAHPLNAPQAVDQESGSQPVELKKEQVERIADALEQFTASMGRELKFQVHEESKRVQVSVIDPRDDRVIKKIPPDEILALAVSIERAVGLFLNRVL